MIFRQTPPSQGVSFNLASSLSDDESAAIDQLTYENALGLIHALANRPDLLKELAREIGRTAAPGSLPTRLQPKRSK